MNKSNIIPLPHSDDSEQQAARWIMRFDDGDVSAEDRALFQAWYDKSEQNKEAMERLSQLWDSLDGLEEFNEYAACDDVAVARLQERPGAVTQRAWKSGFAASIAVLCCVIAYYFFADAGKYFNGAYQTAVGEQKTIALPDGSSIILNTNSAVDVEFTRHSRYVRLIKGEVFFDVAPDPATPFAVHVGKGSVTALGTAFAVRLYDEQFTVVVAEGRVALAALPAMVEPGESNPVVEVVASQVALFDRRVERHRSVSADTLARKLDWQDGVLAFKGEPLEQVIADISRYTDLSINIHDEALRQRPIAGYFKVGEIDALFDALKIMADIDVDYINHRSVQLYRSD